MKLVDCGKLNIEAKHRRKLESLKDMVVDGNIEDWLKQYCHKKNLLAMIDYIQYMDNIKEYRLPLLIGTDYSVTIQCGTI